MAKLCRPDWELRTDGTLFRSVAVRAEAADEEVEGRVATGNRFGLPL